MSALTVARRREMIATGGAMKQDERKKIRTQYDAARNIYVKAAQEHARLIDEAGNAKVDLESLEANQKGVMAGWHLTGMAQGTNKEQRDAAVEHLKLNDETFIDLTVAIDAAKRHLVSLDAEMEKTKTERRLAQYDCEMAIAETMALAGEDELRHER